MQLVGGCLCVRVRLSLSLSLSMRASYWWGGVWVRFQTQWGAVDRCELARMPHVA
jgi:hypothetical protein